MNAIQLTAFGDPTKVLRLADIDVADRLHPAEVSIEMRFAPVNHNDLLLIRGTFPVRPELPAVAGNEGVGRVVDVGSNVDPALIGTHVLAPLYGRTWAERIRAPAAGLVRVPDGDLQQLSMLRINPPTASLLLSEFAPLKAGDWVVQNAANSAVGRAIIAFAKARGLRTINLVRSASRIADVKALGGDIVIEDNDEAVATLGAVLDGAPVPLAIDGVGGHSTARLATVATKNATLVSYAQMGGVEAPGDLRPLMRKGILLTSFYQAMPKYLPKISGILDESIRMVMDGTLSAPIAAVYPAREFAKAIEHTLAGGKVLLELSPGNW
ncbi:zinc-dependent alcohol dehydrogenase family protein [Luteibacter pinisoli]|uniref:enoyl-[acyl-carrier-protein] reductase n=1 Tax=Luteibacter pinisoli TaxID=2589080 RepID=A0A4Y5Z379_9GAMM|nr:zinc-dependent alcohol dehydrogenase family protein [Luteibacter pinisoli]QDE39840.1 zinc-dependent alcohol dehydrogenase family protein [Luteibacter pinisoli]